MRRQQVSVGKLMITSEILEFLEKQKNYPKPIKLEPGEVLTYTYKILHRVFARPQGRSLEFQCVEKLLSYKHPNMLFLLGSEPFWVRNVDSAFPQLCLIFLYQSFLVAVPLSRLKYLRNFR